jgi:long-chain acyl-CoA synthetase
MDVSREVSGPLPVNPAPESWIFDQIRDWTSKAPGRFAFAVDWPDGTVEQYGYGDVLRIAESLGAGLAERGITRQDRIGILMENSPQWVFALLGAMRIGAVTVPLSTLLPESGVANLLAHAGCKLLFTDGPNLAKATRAASAQGAIVVVYGAEAEHPAIPWQELLSRNTPPPMPANNGDEAALIVYTSGTTGDPKGVQLSVWNLIHEIRGAVEALAFSEDHRILSTLPFSHVLPLIANALGPLAAGAGVVFLTNLSAERITEAFRKHRITCFVCVPQFFYLLHRRIFDTVKAQPWLRRTLFALMLAIGRRSGRALRRRLFTSVRKRIAPDLWLLVSGGAPLDPNVGADLLALGYTVTQAYGLTETTAAVTISPQRVSDAVSVGRPIRGVSIRINEPADDGVGEIWIRGPVVMSGYYRDAGKTREVMEGPWFRSGDLGHIRSDGNLVVTGRMKDVIVLANGKKVYPEELERQYGQSPYVKEICVIGLPAAEGPAGETLHAVVTPDLEEFRKRGQNAIMEAIRFDLENLSRDLPSYQHILSISIRNEPLPRTVTRKLRRFEIRAQVLASRRQAREAKPAAENADAAELGKGTGATIARIVREIKPGAAALSRATNLELDLGLDSLARIEFFGKVESRLGTRMDEQDAGAIITIGDLIDALENAGNAPARWQSWEEVILAEPDAEVEKDPVFHRGGLVKAAGYALIKTAGLAASILFPVRSRGQENLPSEGAFLVCPNHQSFLDGPLIVSHLPRAVIDKIVILGYSDYWQNALTRAIARFLSVVSIDSNINLVRAMQAGAVALRRGGALLVFPEGVRSIDGRLLEFKKGAAILARVLNVPIVPVGIRGAYESWPRGGSFRLRPIEIAFGVPLHPREFAGSADPTGALTDALRDRVRQLAGQ